MVFVEIMQLCCRNFSNYKKKKEIGCNLLLVFVRLGFMLVVIGVMLGRFTFATSGPGCLGCGGATGGIRARGLEALGSEGSGFGMFWIKIGLSRVACILVL